MAQQSYGLAFWHGRPNQHEDRSLVQGRQEYDVLALGASSPGPFATLRSGPYMDGSSLFPAPASSYDHTAGGLRLESSSQSLLNMQNQQQGDSHLSDQYSHALQSQPSHKSQYGPTSPHISQTPHLHAHQHAHSQLQAHHPHYPSSPQLAMQMAGEHTSAHPTAGHPHHSYGLYPNSPQHTEYSQDGLDGQRKGKGKSEPSEPHTPRPPNAWILYRSQKFREIQQSRDSQKRTASSEKPKSQAEISRIISQMWQNESSAVRQHFEALADERKLAHQKMYPTYRYRPKKKAKGGKQASPAQRQDRDRDGQRRQQDGHEAFSADHQGRFGQDSYSSADSGKERKGGADSDFGSGNLGANSIHDLAGRDLMSRKTTGDRSYGRPVSGSTSSADNYNSSAYGNHRMHPYGDRASGLMRQESPRSPSVFAQVHSNVPGVHSGSHWSDSDGLGGGSSGTYFGGSRGGVAAPYVVGGSRLTTSNMMGSANVVGDSSLMSLSPPQRQLVPSQQLQPPMEGMQGGNLHLGQLASPGPSAGGGAGYGGANGNGGAGFRIASAPSHGARYVAPFVDERSEMPSGMAVPSNSTALQESFDPHKRF